MIRYGSIALLRRLIGKKPKEEKVLAYRMIRPSSYSILNQHAVLAHRCCVRRTAQVQTRGVVFLAGGGCRRVAAPGRHQDSHHRQQQQQHRKVATSGDASAETALGGGGGGGVAAAAAAGSGSTGGMEQQTRQQATHAISNPVLANIEKRWDEMPPQEQANLWMSLRDRQKVDWHDLTLNEKKAGMCDFLIGCVDASALSSVSCVASLILDL